MATSPSGAMCVRYLRISKRWYLSSMGYSQPGNELLTYTKMEVASRRSSPHFGLFGVVIAEAACSSTSLSTAVCVLVDMSHTGMDEVIKTWQS